MDNYTTTTLAGLVTTPASVTEYSLDASAPFPTVFKIDATYDPTSENAQSGVAVAEALQTVVVPVDQAFSATSENAQSGKAVAGAFSNVYYVKNQGSAICIGRGASVAGPGRQALAIGDGASTGNTTAPMAVGMGTKASGECAVSVGCQIDTVGDYAAAFGSRTRNKDKFTTVIGCYNKDDDTFTQVYVMAAGSPLANTYENGAAALGYVVKNRTTNTIIERGTRKLSELLTNNTDFTPASLDPDAPEPTPFTPTGITDPIEFPEEPEGFSEPEQVTE